MSIDLPIVSIVLTSSCDCGGQQAHQGAQQSEEVPQVSMTLSFAFLFSLVALLKRNIDWRRDIWFGRCLAAVLTSATASFLPTMKRVQRDNDWDRNSRWFRRRFVRILFGFTIVIEWNDNRRRHLYYIVREMSSTRPRFLCSHLSRDTKRTGIEGCSDAELDVFKFLCRFAGTFFAASIGFPPLPARFLFRTCLDFLDDDFVIISSHLCSSNKL
jgi:hypothetical protein